MSEEAASGPSSPKLTSESHRTRELQPNQRDLWPWVGKVNHTSPPNRKTKRLPLTKKKKQAAARTVGSQTTTCTTGAGALQQWRATQASHRLELQRLQHRTGIIIQDTTSAGLAAAGYCSAEDPQPLQSRISNIVQDMDAFGRSCSGEAALDFQSMDDSYDFHRPLASSLGREPPDTAITPKPVVSVASSSGAHNKQKTLPIHLLSATGQKEAATLYKKIKTTTKVTKAQ